MNCPNCGVSMRIINKYDAEIDLCPDCKGIWLDRGELEKIVELIASNSSESTQDRGRVSDALRRDQDDDDDDHRRSFDRDDDREKHNSRGYKRRRSWLGDLFGGDDD